MLYAMDNLYKITGRKGIDDLKSLYAFRSNAQGENTHTNSIQDYEEAKGWLSFIFDCNLTLEAIKEEIQKRKAWNKAYIEKLKETGEYGETYYINVKVQSDPLYDSPKKVKSSPTESYRRIFLDVTEK